MKQGTWFITGISSGIGFSLTNLLLEQGNRVIGTARNPDQLNELKKQNVSNLAVVKLDVTDFESITHVVDETFKSHRAIDVIVSNAGLAIFGAIEELRFDQVQLAVNTNLLGSIRLIQACMPHLRKQGHGRVIQVSSLGGQLTVPGMSVYHATKWGIEGFIDSCRQDMAPFNIDFTLVEPGTTETQALKAGHYIRGNAISEYKGTPSSQTIDLYTSPTFLAPNDPSRLPQLSSLVQPKL